MLKTAINIVHCNKTGSRPEMNETCIICIMYFFFTIETERRLKLKKKSIKNHAYYFFYVRNIFQQLRNIFKCFNDEMIKLIIKITNI